MARRGSGDRYVTDPFVGAEAPSRNAVERGDIKSVRQTFLDRLTMIGATADEIAAADESWDDLDDDWTDEARTQMALEWTDAELAVDLAEARREWAEASEAMSAPVAPVGAPDPGAGTNTADPLGEAVAGAGDVPDDLLSASVPIVEAWVGHDVARALAVLKAEQAKGDAARVTLVAAMTKIATPDA